MSVSVFIVIFWTARLQLCTAALWNASVYRNYTTRNESLNTSSPSPTLNFQKLIIGWIHKPPYLYAVPNATTPSGMGEEMVLKFFTRCGARFLQDRQASSEFEMISLLRHNKIHVAAPIFEPTSHRHYSEFYFIQTHDYPGTVYISIENREDVVLNAVLSAWPLFGINLVLAAIAGIFVWALVSFTSFNILHFKSSFNVSVLFCKTIVTFISRLYFLTLFFILSFIFISLVPLYLFLFDP